MLPLFAVLAAAPAIPAAIGEWRADLEREHGARVPVVWAGAGLRGDEAGFSLVSRQLGLEGFRAQFNLMHAAMISEQSQSGARFVIVVNEAWRPAWEGYEAALLGHELGHVWLRLRRLPAPAFQGGPLGCLAVHTGDIVQHILIRAEMDRRGIAHRDLLARSLDASTAALQAGSQARDDCAWVRQAALWTDARLALEGRPWPGREAYEAAARTRFPEVEASLPNIVAALAGKDLDDRLVHRQALVDVFAILKQLASAQKGRSGQ
jgi:hypothetical protein